MLGSRLDRIILDDILDWESTRTPDQRKATVEWVNSTLLGRLTERGRVIAVGTAFHPDDLLHHLSRQHGWTWARFAAEDETGTPAWPERWSPERLARKRLELGPLEAARQLDVQARSDEDSRIKAAWLDEAFARGANATALSRGPSGELGLLNIREPYRVFIGVDLAVSAKTSADLSAIVVLLHPDKTRELLAVESGRWTAPEIVERIASAYHRLMARAVVVESNAAQAYIGHWLNHQKRGIRVIPHVIGRGERSLEFRVEQLAVQLSRGQWMFPAVNDRPRDREIGAIAQDLAYYHPATHCPDRVAALAFADFGCEQGSQRVEWGYFDTMRR